MLEIVAGWNRIARVSARFASVDMIWTRGLRCCVNCHHAGLKSWWWWGRINIQQALSGQENRRILLFPISSLFECKARNFLCNLSIQDHQNLCIGNIVSQFWSQQDSIRFRAQTRTEMSTLLLLLNQWLVYVFYEVRLYLNQKKVQGLR